MSAKVLIAAAISVAAILGFMSGKIVGPDGMTCVHVRGEPFCIVEAPRE